MQLAHVAKRIVRIQDGHMTADEIIPQEERDQVLKEVASQ